MTPVYLCVMKTLPGNNANAQWKSSLLDDLVFIKQHMRYPMTKKTIPSVFIIGAALASGAYMLWTTVRLGIKGNLWLTWLVLALMTTVYITNVIHYLRTLRFKVIPTSFFAAENMKLIDTFLRHQQLNLYRHPEAPEVFQILSRPLGNNTDQREVMIFIADDKRILVNSHFTNQKWAILNASGNAKQMAKRLKDWIAVNNETAVVVSRT